MRIRLLTYNIHKCIGGFDRRYRPERVAETIAHYRPDFVLLQEVDSDAERSNGDRQVDLLGGLLDMPYRTFFPNVRLRRGGEYGNAILSRFPAAEAENIDLTIPPKKQRSVLHARFRVRQGSASRTVHVYNLHLGLSGLERRTQLARFLESDPFRGLAADTPVVVAGDFNDVWGTLGPKLLTPAGFRGIATPVSTFPAYAPVRALDGVYVRGDVDIAQAYRSKLELARWASDHLPLIAELTLR